jgi:hypothetical protein
LTEGSAFGATVGAMEHASSYEAMGFRVLNQVNDLSPQQQELQKVGVSTHNLKIKASPIQGLQHLHGEVLHVCL